ncbi:unnamed protein product, partial [Effrenium voratum]
MAVPLVLPAPAALEPLRCPHGSGDHWPGSGLFWRQILAASMEGMEHARQGSLPAAKAVLADALQAATGLEPNPRRGFSCSLGVAALYRILALVCLEADGPEMLGHQAALRFQHLATVWVTHVWEKFARREEGGGPGEGWAWYDRSYIDDSAWPIGLRELNVEMHAVQTALAKAGLPKTQRPEIHHGFRDSKMSIGIASLCAYPPDNPLPRYAASNHRAYAARHGYRYRLELTQLAPERPAAWGKVKHMQRVLEEPGVDWWLWFDCDTFFMNMSVTLDSLLCRYAGDTNCQLDDVHMLAAEDAAMLNTGAFLLRSSDWSRGFLQRVWGAEDSVWISHPWWENAAIIWDLLRTTSERARHGNNFEVYPKEVRILPQFELNSYHPATAQSLHDAWQPGKFVLAFNGVLSNTSPGVVRALYGYYYEIACELNGIPLGESQGCLRPEEPLPWLRENTLCP